MPAFSTRRLLRYLLLGGLIGILSLFLFRNQNFLLTLIDGLFLGGLVPFLIGCFLLAKRLGAFDLLAYTHITLKKYSKKYEKQEDDDESADSAALKKSGTYAEYISEKTADSAFKEPLLVGSLLCACSLILTVILY